MNPWNYPLFDMCCLSFFWPKFSIQVQLTKKSKSLALPLEPITDKICWRKPEYIIKQTEANKHTALDCTILQKDWF